MQIDFEVVARRIVGDSLRLGKKDSLGVRATEHMLPLAKEIIKAARRRGADTMLSVDSDDIWYDALMNLPSEWLEAPSALTRAFLRTSTALVHLEGPQDPSRLNAISSSRWEANSKGAAATYSSLENKPVPTVDLGIARVTEDRAKAYGFDYGEWYESVMASLAVDPKLLKARGDRVAKVLTKAKRGWVTAPGGTDFEFELHGSQAAVGSGQVRPVKGKKASYHTALPDGAVAVALRKGSGKGRVVSMMPIPRVGHLIRGLKWEFENGKVKRADAEEHLDHFKSFLTQEKRKKGGDQLGWLNIGLNPGAKFGFLNDSIVNGCVSIGIGDNSELGGTNKSEFGFDIALKGATLEIDGRKVVAAGRIVA